MLTVWLVWRHDPHRLLSPAYLAMMVVFFGMATLRHRSTPPRLRLRGVVVGLTTMGALAIVNFGLAPGPLLCLCLGSVSAAIFMGVPALTVNLVASSMAILAIGYGLQQGYIVPVAPIFATEAMADWARAAFEFGLVGGGFGALTHYMTQAIQRYDALDAQRRRLEALGRLSTGIAHDVGNVLQIVASWADLLADHPDPEVAEGAREMRTSVDRSRGLLSQLLAAAKRRPGSMRAVDLAAAVERWVPVLRRLLPEDIELRVVASARPWVRCDPVQLEQAILNLTVNARDAIDGPGEIRIEIDEVATKDGATMARVRVIDDGPGIPDDILPHIFEPFFTAHKDEGTGLGLAIVQSAVLGAGGRVHVASKPGRTVFTVELPTTPPVEEARAADDRTAPAVGATILWVDDEPAILRGIARVLGRSGFEVLTATSVEEALQLLEAYDGTIDVLCTDAVMPGRPTSELIAAFERRYPEGRILVVSGHAPDDLRRRNIDGPRIRFVTKPFQTTDVLRALRG